MPDYRCNLKLSKLKRDVHTHTHTQSCTQFQASLAWVVATFVGSSLSAFLSHL